VSCTGSVCRTELDFITALRRRGSGACCGPLLTLALVTRRLETMETALAHSERAGEVLWAGFVRGDDPPFRFALCAGHWLDIGFTIQIRAIRLQQLIWRNESINLLRQVCQEAGWDPKEISNMMTWQRVLLT
jgi:hypothetical protein